MTQLTIAALATTPSAYQKAQILSQQLHLPLLQEPSPDYEYFLLISNDYLGLQKTAGKAKPLIIDFLSAKLQYRRKQASLRNELLARALGLKNKSPRRIIDATAGLGRDSFILAALGFEVELLERSPIIHALLDDAIHRALVDPKVAPIAQRLHLINANAIVWLPTQKAEIVYLDPMFPESKKSALSKQDMRIFHDVVGEDTDEEQLLQAALTCATQRVVVKRPRLAKPLAGCKPNLSMDGSSNRFDIYLI